MELLFHVLQYTPVVQQYETPVMEKNGKYPSRENIDEPLRLAIKVNSYILNLWIYIVRRNQRAAVYILDSCPLQLSSQI